MKDKADLYNELEDIIKILGSLRVSFFIREPGGFNVIILAALLRDGGNFPRSRG
jgi:hypothetical protein